MLEARLLGGDVIAVVGVTIVGNAERLDDVAADSLMPIDEGLGISVFHEAWVGNFLFATSSLPVKIEAIGLDFGHSGGIRDGGCGVGRQGQKREEECGESFHEVMTDQFSL